MVLAVPAQDERNLTERIFPDAPEGRPPDRVTHLVQSQERDFPPEIIEAINVRVQRGHVSIDFSSYLRERELRPPDAVGDLGRRLHKSRLVEEFGLRSAATP